MHRYRCEVHNKEACLCRQSKRPRCGEQRSGSSTARRERRITPEHRWRLERPHLRTSARRQTSTTVDLVRPCRDHIVYLTGSLCASRSSAKVAQDAAEAGRRTAVECPRNLRPASSGRRRCREEAGGGGGDTRNARKSGKEEEGRGGGRRRGRGGGTHGGCLRFFLPGIAHSCPPLRQRRHVCGSLVNSQRTFRFLQRTHAPDLRAPKRVSMILFRE